MPNQNDKPFEKDLETEKKIEKENGGDMSFSSPDGVDGGGVLEKAGEAGRSFMDQAKATAGNALEAASAKASTMVEDKKSMLTDGLTGAADTIRRAGDAIGEGDEPNKVTEYAVQYTGQAADKLEQVANYFERTDLKGAAHDLESFARRNPAVFLGAAFALGLLAARLIRSSSPDQAAAGEAAFVPPARNQPHANSAAATAI